MPTLTVYRRALLEAIGGGGVYVTDGGGTPTTVICAAGFKDASLPTDHLAYAWLHVPTCAPPLQRMVTATGLSVATGTITVGAAFGSAVGAAAPFELSSHLPLVDTGAKTTGISLNQCVNLGLRYLVVPDEISVAITTSSEISLATWKEWLDRPDRLRAVLEPHPVTGAAPTDASWRFVRGEPLLTLDAELPKLRLAAPFGAASGSLILQVLRPADTWIRSGGGAWADDTDGLSAEGDEAKPPIEQLVTAASVFAYQAMAQGRAGARRAEYQQRYEAALAEARTLRSWDATRDKLQPPPQQQQPQPQTEAA